MKRSGLLLGLVLGGVACLDQSTNADSSVEKVSARAGHAPVAVYAAPETQPPPELIPMAPIITRRTGAAADTVDTADHGSAATAGAVDESCPGPNCRRNRTWSIYGDWMFLSARGESIPFAQIRDGEGPLAVPRGPVGSVDSDYSSGFRVGGSVGLGNSAELYGAFAWYETNNSANIAVPAGEPLVIHALTVFPTTINAAADSLAASADLDIQYYMADVGVKMPLCTGDCYFVKLVLGGRYAHLDQDFGAEYSLLGETTVGSSIDFDGAGPRIGLEGQYDIHRSVFVFARGSASFLFGEFDADYIQENVFAGVQAETDASDDRVVPILDLEMGLGWQSKGGRVAVSGGYMVQAWFNTMTTSTWIQGVRDSDFTRNRDNLRDTLTFDGLFVRAEFRY
jgi:hypothetical protein